MSWLKNNRNIARKFIRNNNNVIDKITSKTDPKSYNILIIGEKNERNFRFYKFGNSGI